MSLKTQIQISGNQENTSDKLLQKLPAEDESNKKENAREETTQHIGKERIAKTSNQCGFISENVLFEVEYLEHFFI